MAGLKTIRRRITSVRNTKQITRAMKLVSAAKLRRAQDAAVNGASFSRRLQEAIAALLGELPPDFKHPLFAPPENTAPTRRVIVISAERGLCGAYNTNIIKAAGAEENEGGGGPEYVVFGRRGASSARRLDWNLLQVHEGLPEDAVRWPVDEVVEAAIADFLSGKVGEVVLYYTKFISAMTQRVVREPLLPLDALFADAVTEGNPGEAGQAGLRSSPGAAEILDRLLPFLVRAKMRQAALESKASEHAARMTAMDSATNNADDLIARLRLFYNRARQSTITRELIDIVGGAEALK